MTSETMYDLLVIPIGLAVGATILLTITVILCFWSMRRGSQELTNETSNSLATDVAIGRRQELDQSQEPSIDLELGIAPTDQSLHSSNHENLFDDVDIKGIVELGVKEQWYVFEDQVQIDQHGISTNGSWGSVFKAKLHGRVDIAMKAPARHDLSSARAIANEMRLFRHVCHPNIVRCYGVSILKLPDPKLCLLLEWVSGGDFYLFVNLRRDEFKEECKKVAAAAKEGASVHITDVKEVKLLADVATGMEYLHSQKPPILHMDLKPQNILIEAKDGASVAKIADFGFSKHLMSARRNDEQEQVGTLRYMAPEVAMRRPYTLSADVYSYGCTVLFALTGKHPPKMQEALDPYIKMLKQKMEVDEIPAVLLRLIKCCTRTRPEKRPPFATVLLCLSSKLVDAGNTEGSARLRDLDSSSTTTAGLEAFTPPSSSRSLDYSSDKMKNSDDEASDPTKKAAVQNEQKLAAFLQLMRMRRASGGNSPLGQAQAGEQKTAKKMIASALSGTSSKEHSRDWSTKSAENKSAENTSDSVSSSSRSPKDMPLMPQKKRAAAAQALEDIILESKRGRDGTSSSKASL
eukprot:TRINITY_DN9078_c0_g2_i3.p1 TRINITY_DN9078_c0_g2~~TRINITY_DN9078_c0_g2_i3.p1  ORF type:complete len:576 (+),score=122.62 TRINITY_DN9078_c0_g2_i3:103-1830(+)